MISIKDVATEAGVSDKTVSRVVNQEANVKPEMVKRVQAAIEKLNYVPNLGARMVRTQQSQTFGILTDYISTTPYSGAIVRGAQDWARANERTILLVDTENNPEQEAAAWRTFREHRIGGVLYVTMYHQVIDKPRSDFLLPTVLVNCRLADVGGIASIAPNDYEGSLRLADYVFAAGHKRVAYIQLNPLLHGGAERLRAFRERARRVDARAGDIVERVGMTGRIGQEENFVFQQSLDLLSGPQRPSAILCGNDEMALQVYLAALSLGLRIPQDISIVGFDDFQTISLALKPALTTAALPYYDLGFFGAKRLAQLLSDKKTTESSLLVDCPLIVRDSCRNVA